MYVVAKVSELVRLGVYPSVMEDLELGFMVDLPIYISPTTEVKIPMDVAKKHDLMEAINV